MGFGSSYHSVRFMFDIEHRKLAPFWLRLLLLRSSSDRPVVLELSAWAKNSQLLLVREQLASLQSRRCKDNHYTTGTLLEKKKNIVIFYMVMLM